MARVVWPPHRLTVPSAFRKESRRFELFVGEEIFKNLLPPAASLVTGGNR